MVRRSELHEGMIVRSYDGHRLGHVIAVGDRGLVVEKGYFFPQDFLAAYDEIATAGGGEIYLKLGREALHRESEKESRQAFVAGRGPDSVHP